MLKKLRLTIGAKLVGLIAVLLLGSILSLVWLSTRMYVESDTALIQQANADSAANLASQMRELFQTLTEKMRVMGTILLEDPSTGSTLSAPASTPNPVAGTHKKSQLISEFFTKDKDFLGLLLVRLEKTAAVSIQARAISPEMTKYRDPEGLQVFQKLSTDRDFSMDHLTHGEPQITLIPLFEGESALVIGIPFIQDPTEPSRFSHVLVSWVKQGRFVKAFADNTTVTSFMVDRKGMVLAHPDAELLNSKADYSQSVIVKQLMEGKFSNGQTRYLDLRNQEPRLGAFRVVGFGGLGVVAEVAEAKAFEAANRVEYQSTLVAWLILCVAFLLGYLYSGTITWPIKQLSQAAVQIMEGDFNVNLKPRGRDEISHLSATFNEMAKGLEERDRVKETFNKFHNKEIAEKLLSGEVKLGGEKKEATVFFSDVRGFTALSESMTPEEVVEMLNEYMTRMVAIIRAHGGVVDKYVGDAIMALWGVPLTGGDDACQAVKACLAMREDLAKLNELRIARKQPVLKIGMGLNSGLVIAGNIGSNEKMEYTVIGDAVNLASRIESMTKEYGTDLLISKSVHEKVQTRFILEAGKAAKVKGKSEAIEVFMVRGYIDENGKPVRIETPYSTYAAEKSDKVVHDSPATPTPTPPPFPGSRTQSVVLPPPFRKNNPR